MEFHQLRDFVAVASTGNFSQAASQCHVAQPSLSKAVQRLEAEVGEELFVRSKRGTVLTAAGEILNRHAIRALHELDMAKREIAEKKGILTGTLKVGVVSTISAYFLPQVFAPFSRKFPTFQVDVIEEKAADLHRLAHAGDLDVALVSLPLPGNGVEKELLFEEELLLVTAPDHALAKKEKIELNDLEKERFVLMKNGHCLTAQVQTFFQKVGIQLKCAFRTPNIETVQSMVMLGLGISFVPQMTRSARIPLVYRSLENPKPTRSITAIWKTGRKHTRGAVEFLNDLRQTAKAFSETLNK